MSSPKPYFVYLPGLDGTGRLIEWQTPLYDEYEVIALSYPQDRKTTFEELADLAYERLVAETNGQKAVVLTESFGGGVAILFALKYPELIERLVLVNTYAWFPNRFIIRIVEWLSYLLPPARVGPFLKLLPIRRLLGRDLPQSEIQRFREAVKHVPMSTLGQRLRMIARQDQRRLLPQIPVPTLVVVSPKDQIVHPKASRELAAKIPNAHLIEIPTGHASLIHPKSNVLEWLKDSGNWTVS